MEIKQDYPILAYRQVNLFVETLFAPKQKIQPPPPPPKPHS